MALQKFELMTIPVTELKTENMSDRKFKLTYLLDGETYKEYEVEFVNEDGTQISIKSDYHYGDALVLPAEPTRAIS